MPQNITAKLHHLVTCAANDLVTFDVSVGISSFKVRNTGPGAVYISLDPLVPATVGGTETILVDKGYTYQDDRLGPNGYGSMITMIADQANTVVSTTFSH